MNSSTVSKVAQFRGGLRFVQNSPHLVAVVTVGFLTAFLGAPMLAFLPV